MDGNRDAGSLSRWESWSEDVMVIDRRSTAASKANNEEILAKF